MSYPKSITVPDHLAPAQCNQKFHALVDDFVALPIIQKNLVKYEMVRRIVLTLWSLKLIYHVSVAPK
jgi:hypothetical protein